MSVTTDVTVNHDGKPLFTLAGIGPGELRTLAWDIASQLLRAADECQAAAELQFASHVSVHPGQAPYPLLLVGEEMLRCDK